MMGKRKITALAMAALAASATGATASEPFLGEIITFPMSFCPKFFVPADGQLLPISQNQALFALLGTNFGGNGTTNFALPDLRGRVMIGVGQGGGLSSYQVGQSGGVSDVTLTAAQLPLHAHLVDDLGAPAGVLAKSSNGPIASVERIDAGAAVDSSVAGGGQAHSNMQPSLAMTACIALQGIFPPQN